MKTNAFIDVMMKEMLNNRSLIFSSLEVPSDTIRYKVLKNRTSAPEVEYTFITNKNTIINPYYVKPTIPFPTSFYFMEEV